ncbi:MAG: DNA-processing protein DprA [Zoogloeaceae bacterium]|jgi:DNA processing protein|nr:DNA-processing protein DprA [Zoogloeaceae bacterium]
MSITERGELAAWLRLTLIPGIGGESQRKLLTAFGLPDNIFSAGFSALQDVIGGKASLLLNTDVEAKVNAALDWASQPQQCIVTLADEEYPRALLETSDPPVLLYARGHTALLQSPALAIVGSRNATPQGRKIAEDFAATLAGAGLAIVSGLALGIDAAAHQGALAGAKARGRKETTIAVIGTGADRLYPARNKELAWEISLHGLILSEFPLGTPAMAANFPRRNRVISGLSRGVLVVEAAPQSGSLITARLAGEQGREVFAVPGSIYSTLSKGCHKLIRQGAKLTESAEDVLEELKELRPPATSPARNHAARATQPADASQPPAGSLEDCVLTLLAGAPCTLDELAAATALSADALLPALLSLELEGLLAPLPGNRYQRL